MTPSPRDSWQPPVRQTDRMRGGIWSIGLILLLGFSFPRVTRATDALILGRDVPILQAPHSAAAVIKTAHPGETYEVVGRKIGKGQPLYILDEKGNLWMKVRVGDEPPGYVRTDGVSVSHEEYRSPKGAPMLLVNQRPTADGAIVRELWLVHEGWQRTRRLAIIEGRPIWASHGDWFLCQVDSERPIKDQTVDRTIERIERFSADGRSRSILAAGSYPLLDEARGEVYFYRDLDEQGDGVPPGMFAVSVEGNSLHPVFLLPEGYRFWREDGDFYVQAPQPSLQASANRIVLYGFDRKGVKSRFTITLDGHLFELRID